MENAELPISVFLRKDYHPHFLDLSGDNVFDFYLEILRNHPADTDERDLTLLVDDSVFDISYAFQHGLLELIDDETGAVLIWPHSAKKPSKRQAKRFITVPRRSSFPVRRGWRVRKGTCSVPFDFLEEFKTVLQPGRAYRIRLRDLDLNVQWWSFSAPPNLAELETLPPSAQQKLVSKTTTNKFFHAVSSIRSPPPISVSMSLPTGTVSLTDPPATLHVSITNNGAQAITVKSSGEQPYTTTHAVNPNDPQITSRPFSLKNFLITTSSGSTILDIPACASAIEHGLSKSSFTTLEPGVPLMLAAGFGSQYWLKAKFKKHENEEFLLTLKRREAWWCQGSVEELFREKEKLSWQSLCRDACLPVVLESEDVVLFRVTEA